MAIEIKGLAGSKLIINGKIKVIANDIQASNGVIHVIETVLLPPSQSIVEIAASNPQFKL